MRRPGVTPGRLLLCECGRVRRTDKLEINPDPADRQLIGRIAEPNRPLAGGDMGGIHGGGESLIGGADVQVAVLTEHVGAVAKGDANASPLLVQQSPRLRSRGRS